MKHLKLIIYTLLATIFLIFIIIIYISASVPNINVIKIEKKYSCTDSDNGINPFIKGSVTLKSPCDSVNGIAEPVDADGFSPLSNSKTNKLCDKTYGDYCINSSTLVEYSCLDSFSINKQIDCENGCLNGRCLEPGPNVYLVIASDTEAYLEGSNYRYNLQYNFENYEGVSSFTGKIFNPDTRTGITDSYRTPLKITWYIATGEAMCEAINANCASIYYHLIKNWGNEINQYGDGLEWHLHNEYWDPVKRCWPQATFFDKGRQEVTERILNHFLIDYGFFPSSYRGGWVWENNELSNFLEDTIFSDYSNLAPLKKTSQPGVRCQGNIYDWSEALDNWDWYNPSFDNYQAPGDQDRTMFRCFFMGTYEIDQLFQRAIETNNSVIGCYYFHNTDNFSPSLEKMINNRFKPKSLDYGVNFTFVTAQEATQIALESRDSTAPTITLSYNNIINAETDEPLYGIPYAAVKVGDEYQRLEVTGSGSSWSVVIPEEIANSDFTFALAATDLSGNVAVIKENYNSFKFKLPIKEIFK